MTKNAAAEPPSKMFYKPGQALTLDSALKILLVKSANDIAVAISETVGGSEEGFVARMNAEAQRLGMRNSRFVNPHGLPKLGQYTTARDLAILAVTLKREFPEYAGYFALEGFTTGKKVYPNYNLLIGRFDGADGMKTASSAPLASTRCPRRPAMAARSSPSCSAPTAWAGGPTNRRGCCRRVSPIPASTSRS